jgi:hypothetical protein
MFTFTALCIAGGLFPGLVIDALGPVVGDLIGASLPLQEGQPYVSIVPVAGSRNSYSGLLLFLLVAATAGVTALLIHAVAGRTTRRGPAWDCGFPDSSPQTQYSAASFAQPIRRVFGTMIFRARESVTIPPPGDIRPARFKASLRDLAWEWFYAPPAAFVDFAAGRLNHLQFLTIRRYLGLVFFALIFLLLVLALWQ